MKENGKRDAAGSPQESGRRRDASGKEPGTLRDEMASRLRGLRDELERELRGNILPYWATHMPDELYGGFHGHVTHDNRVVEGAGKGAVLNARILWTFSAATRRYREERDAEIARRAFAYLTEHFMDREMGGVFWELDHLGRVRQSRKQIYAIAFVIYALAEYHMAFGSREALQTATGLFQDIEQHAFDRQMNGYTEALSRDWGPLEDLRLSEKDANETKTMNTHLHILEAYTTLYRVWKDPRLEKALRNLVELFLEKFIDRTSWHLNLFFDDSWNLRSGLVSYGHDIECSWLLHEAATALGQSRLSAETSSVAVRMASANLSGLDTDHGLFYETFPDGTTDTDKHWWPQAEALVGYFNAWQISCDEAFLHHTLESWEFIREKIVDREHGEWYWSVSREGIPQREKEKAGFWKCPYHNGRACMELITRIKETGVA